MFNRDRLHNHIFYYILLCIIATMPFFITINSICIILLILNWLAEGNFREKYKRLLDNKGILLFMGLYLLHVLGLLYTENAKEGIFDLEKKLSLLMLPLVIGTSERIGQKRIDKLLKAFISCTALAVTICLTYAFYKYTQDGATHYFYYHELGAILNFHAVYFSFYLGFSLFIIASTLVKDHELRVSHKIFYYFLIILFLIFIFLLSSKTIIISICFIATVFLIVLITRRKSFLIAMAYVLMLNTFAFLLLYNLPFTKARFQEIVNARLDFMDQKEYAQETVFNGASIRVAIFKFSAEILNDNRAWLFGLGTGDAQDNLTRMYLKNNLYPGNEDLGIVGFTEYNAHNQYLQFLLSFGLMGLAYFCICLWHPIRTAYNSGNYLFITLMALFMIFCMTESVLCRHKGVVFFSFFTSLLAFNTYQKPTNKIPDNV